MLVWLGSQVQEVLRPSHLRSRLNQFPAVQNSWSSTVVVAPEVRVIVVAAS
jgi:hypothetical protein